MKKEDLEQGDVIVSRDYFNGVVHRDGISYRGEQGNCNLSSFNDDLTCKDEINELDIMKVYRLSSAGFSQFMNAYSTNLFLENLEPMWERKDEV